MSNESRPPIRPCNVAGIPGELAELQGWSSFKRYERGHAGWEPYYLRHSKGNAMPTLAETLKRWSDYAGVGLVIPEGMAAIVLRDVFDHDDEDADTLEDTAPEHVRAIINAARAAGAYAEHKSQHGVDLALVGRATGEVASRTNQHVDILGPGKFLPLHGATGNRAQAKLGSIDEAIKLATRSLHKRMPPRIKGLVRLGQRAPGAVVGAPMQHFIPHRALVRIFGPSGGGKTYACIDMGLSLGHGLPWFGRKVNACPVLYCLSESVAGFPARIAAWAKAHPDVQLNGERFAHYEGALDILDDDGKKLAELLDATGAQVAFLDVLSEHIGSGDENSSVDMSRFIKILKRLAVRFDCSFVLVHHSGLKEQDRARGSSVIRAAMDVEMRLAPVGGGDVKVAVTKMRDGAVPAPFAVRLQAVTLDERDEFGDPVTACVVVPASLPPAATEPPAVSHKPRLTRATRKAFDALRGFAAGKPPTDGHVELTEAEVDKVLFGVDDDRKAVYRAKKALQECGALTARNGAWQFAGAAA
jgi:hypothetical protein